MATTLLWFTIVCSVFPVLVLGDYQIELDLRSYNNTGGRQSDQTCCDAMRPNGACFPADTCDTRLTFSVRNFDTNAMFPSQTKTVGDYDDTDIINFPNCSQLINGPSNPLTFVISPSEWGDGNRIQFQVSVLDIDINQDGTTDREEIADIFLPEITRPNAPSATFTQFQNYTGGSTQIELRYRIICTTGMCGATCTQTSNCFPFESVCTGGLAPMSCDDDPCQNGGTCNTIPGGYQCSCVGGFDGQNCDMVNPCFSNPCMNEGTCGQVPGSSNFVCTCPPSYTGDTCTDAVTTSSSPMAMTSDGNETPDDSTTENSTAIYTMLTTDSGSSGIKGAVVTTIGVVFVTLLVTMEI